MKEQRNKGTKATCKPLLFFSCFLLSFISLLFLVSIIPPRYGVAQSQSSEDFNPDCSKEIVALARAVELLRATKELIQKLEGEVSILSAEILKLRDINENVLQPQLDRLRRELRVLEKKEKKECAKNKNAVTKTQACSFAEAAVDAKNMEIRPINTEFITNDEKIKLDRKLLAQDLKILGQKIPLVPDLEADVTEKEVALEECEKRKK